MWHKRQGPDRDIDDKAKKFKANIDDLFLSNQISGVRAHSIYQDGSDCNLEGWGQRARAGNRGLHEGNIHRDLLNQMTKGVRWPKLHYASVRIWSQKASALRWVKLPFFLPHEIIYAIGRISDHAAMCSHEGLCAASSEHMARAMQELACLQLVAVGLWGDGTPCNWDRSQSIETFSINLPGLPGAGKNLRVPVTAINKNSMAKNITADDIMKVIAWSFKVLATGTMPSVDHEGNPLTGKRKKLAGKTMPKGVLAEVRADWAYLKSTFRLPQHNENDGICWQCTATPDDIRCCTSGATWKQNRLSHYDMAKRMVDKGLSLPPLLGAPCFRISCFLVDWLHCADLGITSDFLGGLFTVLLDKFPGASKEVRCRALWQRLQQFYKDASAESRLDNLKPSMIKQPKKHPKLRAKAAEARGLVPFGHMMAQELLGDEGVEMAAKAAMQHLQECYSMLSVASFNSDVMATSSHKFCVLYVALEEALPSVFHIKPKLHMFQELTQMSRSCPSLFWTYRDEEFGGTVASLARRRGGSNNAVATALSVLQKFRASNVVPCL